MLRINLLIPPWVGNTPGKEMFIITHLLMNDNYREIMPYIGGKSKSFLSLKENAFFTVLALL